MQVDYGNDRREMFDPVSREQAEAKVRQFFDQDDGAEPAERIERITLYRKPALTTNRRRAKPARPSADR